MRGRASNGNVTWGTAARSAASVPCQAMCGRFVQVSSPDLLVERFNVDEVTTPQREPSYNVAPRATVYAVRDRAVDDERRRYLSEVRWGLVPTWAKDPKTGDRMINARAESVTDKPAYERAFRRHRCLVPADGFYEWQQRGRRKQPMFVHRRDGEPMALAGLWAAWHDPNTPDGEWLHSCTIVTTQANTVVAPLHDRMPVVLEQGDWDRWLDPSTEGTGALERLLAPAPNDVLAAYPVSSAVNSADNDGPELVQRVELEPSLGL
jgi:putative SOS response-associated peptidase YedK